MKRYLSFFSMLFVLISVNNVYGYVSSDYATLDTWGKHFNSNGVRYSTNGIDLGDNGNLKLGLTTRLNLKTSEYNDISVYQYFRGRLSDFELGSGYMHVNLNLRGGWRNNPNPTGVEDWAYYNSLRLSKYPGDADLRIYQANVMFEKVIPLTDIHLGRIYLSTFEGYKIDGLNVSVEPLEYLKLNLFYGLPVSYYSDLDTTQVAGITLDVPLNMIGTRVRGTFNYFFQADQVQPETIVGKVRVDQSVPYTHLYAEGMFIGDATIYEIGLDTNIDFTGTGLSGYFLGQAGLNNDKINPYVGLYESLVGDSSEYFMGGFLLTQGIVETVMVGFGFEARYNLENNYSDRDYYRIFASLDFPGLIHENNFFSIIADWYDIAELGRNESNQELLVGFRMSQRLFNSLELWTGFNVMNYQYKNNPIKYYSGEPGADLLNEFGQESFSDNTAIAYIGGMYQITDWCIVQLDYMFDYSDLLGRLSNRPDIHIVELWVNFLW